MISVNTNSTATVASFNLNSSNTLLRNSLNRLSSGRRIVNPSDDAGGMAVSMKLDAALSRSRAVSHNISNAVSYAQVQDGAMKTVGSILDRMSELKSMSEDITKNTSDKDNYNTEFQQLRSQLHNITQQTFNGVSVFGGGNGVAKSAANSTIRKVYTTEQGSANGVVISLSQANLSAALGISGGGIASKAEGNGTTTFTDTSAAKTAGQGLLGTGTDLTSGSASLGAFALANITEAIQNLATLRASNGGEQSRLGFAQNLLSENIINLEAANSRIIDVDVAEETTKFARYNVLVQAGASMVSQANALTNVALQLLQ